MKIKYYGHACFTVESDGFTVAIDPYDPIPGYPELSLSANEVCCSHGHLDHCFVDAVELVKTDKVNPFKVSEYGVPHDDKGGALRGENTLRIFEAEGKRVVHFGDCGCMPLDDVLNAINGADAFLIPVGGYYTIDAQKAAEIAEKTAPKLIIPMHYKKGDTGLPVISELSDCLKAFEGLNMNVQVLDYKEEKEI